MAEFKVAPPGWDGQPVVLLHLAAKDSDGAPILHPADPTLRLAFCAPCWFRLVPEEPGMTLILCPACMKGQAFHGK